jgi:membrane associated rhomboid family serine protease
VFIPLYDAVPLRSIRTPFVTYALIALCCGLFVVFQSGLVVDARYASIVGMSMIPAELTHASDIRSPLLDLPEAVTMITYMFVHGGWMHLIGNMLFLWVFGDNVEDAMGHWRFLAFYLVCGICAGLVHSLASPVSPVPLVGASGAVAGVVAAYLLLHPRVKLWVLLLGRLPLRISAMWVIGGWIVFQLVMVVIASDHTTAWWAHIGGFSAGAALTPLLRRADVPLFDRAPVT